eukprot:3680608-Rhodomonas_salina.3
MPIPVVKPGLPDAPVQPRCDPNHPRRVLTGDFVLRQAVVLPGSSRSPNTMLSMVVRASERSRKC